MDETFISVVRPGKASSVRRATRPVFTSSLVVPPTSGENVEFDSPKMPWQDAHLASHTSWPWLTEPLPLGRPLKSGRTSMSQAATSLGVASRPMPGKAVCASAAPTASRATAISSSRELNILHLAAFLHQPRLDRVVVIDRARAAHRAVLPVGRLHVAGVVGGAALHQGRLAVPHPVDVEAGQALGH